MAAVVGRPRFKATAWSELAASKGTAQAVLEAFREFGPSFLEGLSGGFALAIVADDGSEGMLATDRIGGRFPLAYRSVPGGVLFGSSPDNIRGHSIGSSEIDLQSIFDYLYFNVVPGPRSARVGVRYLPAAHLLHYKDGESEVRAYWKPVYRSDPRANLKDLSEEFRSSIRDAVRRNCEGEGVVGSFLSGGIDSSTVAGLVGQVTGAPARTFSIGFDADGFDEMNYARMAAERFKTQQSEYYVQPNDIIEILPKLARAFAEPFGNASAIPVYCCARLAKERGIDRMLGGDGGDELFGGNSRYATQKIFGVYDRIPGALRRGLIEPLVLDLPLSGLFPPTRKIRRYVEQARVPMPARLETYNQLERYGVEHVLAPEFLAAIDPRGPRELLDETYRGADADDMVSRMLALDMKFTIADNDLPKVSVMSGLAGIEVGYPFLDDEIVEFALRVPPEWKLRGLKLRWFVKQALRGFLPDAILEKKKQGFGLPFGLWMRDHKPLETFVLDHLESLKKRRIVRADFIDDLVRKHATDHATYYGVMIWVLLVLELWFETKVDSR